MPQKIVAVPDAASAGNEKVRRRGLFTCVAGYHGRTGEKPARTAQSKRAQGGKHDGERRTKQGIS